MAPRKKTANRAKQNKLTDPEMAVATKRMMTAAQAHQRASFWCKQNPDAKLPKVEAFQFLVVSFELLLLSVEQCLKLMLLLFFSRTLSDHNPRVLYRAILAESKGDKRIERVIVSRMNEVGLSNSFNPFSEEELVACLEKHDSSYVTFRYFQLDRHGRLTDKWEFTPREMQVLDCLALALISIGKEEMARRGIVLNNSLSLVQESEMTPELKALKERLRLS